MYQYSDIFQRSSALLGADAMARIKATKVIIFGVGGVGSWCVEGLVRTGFEQITMVDFDDVCPSNINRQAMATTETVGEPKVESMRRRLLQINPEANIVAINGAYNAETAANFHLEDYDFVIDAIDSLNDKIRLIINACNTKATFYSSMGAAMKIDPSKVRTAEFWKVQGCPLARALRKRMKDAGEFPTRKFTCVYSDEQPPIHNREIKGSLMHITAVFGLTIAGMVIREVIG
ncbi:MAG: tRNA threonylcarbamoyladenosine dehydratase [Bacteroidales bacterium]|nr:tRNA threonylcarbamoyladenosine dehydratase [Bacteroidales bacterium]